MRSYEIYSMGEAITHMKRGLSEIMGVELGSTPIFDPISQSVLRKYQISQGFQEVSKHGVCYGPQSQQALSAYIEEHFVTEPTWRAMSAHLELTPACLQAASAACALHPRRLNGKLNTRFDRLAFFRLVSERMSAQQALQWSSEHPSVCANLGDTPYDGAQQEHNKLELALKLHPEASECAKFGSFMIPGGSWLRCGLTRAVDVADVVGSGERAEFELWCQYLLSLPEALQELRAARWGGFLRRYHGPAAVTGLGPWMDHLHDELSAVS